MCLWKTVTRFSTVFMQSSNELQQCVYGKQ